MSTTTALTPPKSGTKQALFLQRLEGTGASVPDLMKATGWQSHTVRAAMTGLRKRGFQIERVEPAGEGKALYRLKPTAATPRKRRSK
jgi:hypothetical protein